MTLPCQRALHSAGIPVRALGPSGPVKENLPD